MNNHIYLRTCVLIFIFAGIISCRNTHQADDEKTQPLQKEIILNVDKQFQTIDGFGGMVI